MVPVNLWRLAGTSHSRPVLESVMYAFYVATHFHRNIYFAFLPHFYFSFRNLGAVDALFTIICNTPMISNPMIHLNIGVVLGPTSYKLLLR